MLPVGEQGREQHNKKEGNFWGDTNIPRKPLHTRLYAYFISLILKNKNNKKRKLKRKPYEIEIISIIESLRGLFYLINI